MGNRIERVMIVGPLAVFADGFAAELERLGYSPFTAVEHVRLMAHLSRWMEDGGVDVAELTVARAHAFLADRRERGHAHRCSPRALDPLLGFLRGLGVAPPVTPAPIQTVTDRLLAEFENHLLADRGLSDRTVAGYRRIAKVFLADRFPDGELRLEQLTAADVSAFMLAQAGWRNAGGAEHDGHGIAGAAAVPLSPWVHAAGACGRGAGSRAASPTSVDDALARRGRQAVSQL